MIPKKRIGLIVDEWGAWHDAEPGTNPNFCINCSIRTGLTAAVVGDEIC
jgi:alpha-N-arabinofuranosidase